MNIHPVFIQAFYYAILMGLTFALVGVLLRGFFWKYVKVRISFGKLVLVKIRSTLRDYYAVGQVIDGFLVFKINKKKRRLVLNTPHKKPKRPFEEAQKTKDGRIALELPTELNPFYKSLSVAWVDVSEEKNGICSVNYELLTGWDAEKYANLYERCLMAPTEPDKKEIIIIVGVIVACLIGLAALYLDYTNYKAIQLITPALNGIKELVKNAATVVGSSNII